MCRKLTQEELERREKESKLSEVDSKALCSEEEVRALKQKIKDIEEEMQQNERSLKSEVRNIYCHCILNPAHQSQSQLPAFAF